jgi:osmotically-inducible protein OsmY
MDQEEISVVRHDLDIREDIYRLMSHYPPLNHDRHQIEVEVEDGVVKLRGYARSRPTYRYLLDHIPSIRGVRAVDADELFCDEILRLDLGRLVPYGVIVNLEYGTAILTGRLPEDYSIEKLVKQIAQVRGVHRVVTSLK